MTFPRYLFTFILITRLVHKTCPKIPVLRAGYSSGDCMVLLFLLRTRPSYYWISYFERFFSDAVRKCVQSMVDVLLD